MADAVEKCIEICVWDLFKIFSNQHYCACNLYNLIKCHLRSDNICPCVFETELQWIEDVRHDDSIHQALIALPVYMYRMNTQKLEGNLPSKWQSCFTVCCVFCLAQAITKTNRVTARGDLLRRAPLSCTDSASGPVATQPVKSASELLASRITSTQPGPFFHFNVLLISDQLCGSESL